MMIRTMAGATEPRTSVRPLEPIRFLILRHLGHSVPSLAWLVAVRSHRPIIVGPEMTCPGRNRGRPGGRPGTRPWSTRMRRSRGHRSQWAHRRSGNGAHHLCGNHPGRGDHHGVLVDTLLRGVRSGSHEGVPTYRQLHAELAVGSDHGGLRRTPALDRDDRPCDCTGCCPDWSSILHEATNHHSVLSRRRGAAGSGQSANGQPNPHPVPHPPPLPHWTSTPGTDRQLSRPHNRIRLNV